VKDKRNLGLLFGLVGILSLSPGSRDIFSFDPGASPQKPFFERAYLDTGFANRSALPNLASSEDGTIYSAFAVDVQSIWLTWTGDSGRTWAVPVRVMGCPRAGYIADPNVLISAKRITVFATFVPAPTPPFGRSETIRATSEDGGRTWSRPASMPVPHRYTSGKVHVPVWLDPETVVMGYSWDILAEEGRPASQEGSMDGRAGVLISRDRGQTWTPGGDVHVSAPMGADEPGLVRLRNGHLFAVVRTTIRPYETVSRDGGLTWDEPKPSPFEGFNSPTALLRLRDGSILRVWDNSSSRRYPLVASLSKDECRSWSSLRTITEPERDSRGQQSFDTACYPSIAQSRDGTIILLWWETSAAGSNIGLARFNKEWVEELRH
jgi:hypothetical protein